MLYRFLAFLFTFLLPSLGLAAETCFKFFPKSYRIVEGHHAYAVAKDRFVSFGCPAGKRIVAQDRLKGLCLFEDAANHPFYLGDPEPPLHFCPSRTMRYVKIRSYPYAIYPGRLVKGVGREGAIFGECCEWVGITDAQGRWFDSEAIRKLLRKKTYHGDIGLRFGKRKGVPVVSAVDPFAGLSVRPKERVLAVGDTRHPTPRRLAEAIDGCRAGGKLVLVFENGGRKRRENLLCFERFGGGKVSDTFLERFGLRFAKGLVITEIDPEGAAYRRGLRRGDRLLAIDGERVGDEEDVRKILTRYAAGKSVPERMLWERDAFQFFLPLPEI
ncbi:PDZ domain-containing protein [Hydrogenimonas urashimensis]|uniref:PDZ domain-containing protein n=1 Tax=Hydrogenimonas urashimensis TaxID=2740515 RepID=UPI0019158020|nr:PDZ domain-containing protein [Hydrogenimonas urashimensis]